MRDYHEVAAELRQLIDAGEFPSWELAPQKDMAARLGVSEPQYRDALVPLRVEGTVRSRRGRPTTIRRVPVMDRDAQQRFRQREAGNARGAFEAELNRMGFDYYGDPDAAVIEERDAPDEGVKALLGDRVLVRPRRMFAVDRDGGKRWPIQIAPSYLPVDITAGTQLGQLDTGPGGTYSRLAELGHAVVTMEERIVSRVPSDSEAAFLDLDELYGQVHRIRRFASDAANRVVEITDTIISTAQVRLIYRWDA